MQLNKLLIVVLLLSVLYACKSNTRNRVENKKGDADFTNVLDVDSRISSADSLVFVFYIDPFGEDSLRYTRFYTQYETRDPAIIRDIQKNAALPATKLEKIRRCRSEGKIWMYSKGKIFQTMYVGFSKDSCRFIYLVKDGFFYYMELEKQLPGLLNRLKLLARNPGGPSS